MPVSLISSTLLPLRYSAHFILSKLTSPGRLCQRRDKKKRIKDPLFQSFISINQRALPPPPRPAEKPPLLPKPPPEKLLELPPPPLNELLPPWQFTQAEPLPLEGALNDLPEVPKDLPEPSVDLKLRFPAEGEMEDLSLVTLESLEDLPSLGEDTREFVSFRLSELLRSFTERSPLLSKD
jgi:hypothetical protein